MNFFTKRAWHITYFIGSIIANFANCFFSNIISFEVQEGKAFNWKLLLANHLFWCWIVVTCLYTVVSIYLTQKEKREKQAKKTYTESYDDAHKKLLEAAAQAYSEGKFETADKMLNALEKIESMRVRYSPAIRKKKKGEKPLVKKG